MRLNIDHVRSILLYLEENLDVSEDEGFIEIGYRDISSATKISRSEVINTLFVLNDAGFILSGCDFSAGIEELDVTRLTYDGYQFLETIRPETVFQKTKNIAGKIGSFSFKTITEIATPLISSMISAQLGFPPSP